MTIMAMTVNTVLSLVLLAAGISIISMAGRERPEHIIRDDYQVHQSEVGYVAELALAAFCFYLIYLIWRP